jgi:Zn-dependent protease with chaperone function
MAAPLPPCPRRLNPTGVQIPFRFQLHFGVVPNQLEMPIAANFVNLLFVPVTVLLLPIVLTLWFRWTAHQGDEPKQKLVWAAYRGFGRFILTIAVAAWWVMWDLPGRSQLVSAAVRTWLGVLELPSAETGLFWGPPIVSLGIFLILCYRFDKKILRLKWTITDNLRQAWWRLVSFVIPLLMVATGFDIILDGKARGIAWLLAAGVVSKVGTGFLRHAEGMKFNALKSGELRTRALSIARRMGVTLRRVYVVPAGKGHLTNAYGMSNAVALTDNLGKYLTKMQIEYVVAHEMAHVKLKHGRKHLLLVITIFATLALLLFHLPQQAMPFRPLVQVAAMIGPLVALYYCSRRFEYSADGEAVNYTGDPETAISALANLYQARELPTAFNRFNELFMTHPTFAHRVRAIANIGRIPAERLAHVLEEARISESLFLD